MYKIKNITRGSLSIILEKGSIILTSGSMYDLDGVCSRKWINFNPGLRKLIDAGCIIVTVDTEKNLVKTPIKDVANADQYLDIYVKKERPKPTKKDLCIAYRNAKLAGLNVNPNHKKIDLFNDVNIENTSNYDNTPTNVKPVNIPTFNYKNDNEPIFLDFTKVLEDSSVPIKEKQEENAFPIIENVEDPIEKIINNTKK